MKNRRFLFLLLQPALILAISPRIFSADRERAAAQQPSIAGCNVFPANNIWNTRIDTALSAPVTATFSCSRADHANCTNSTTHTQLWTDGVLTPARCST